MFTEEILNNLDDDIYIEVCRDVFLDGFVVAVRNYKYKRIVKKMYPIQDVLEPCFGIFIEQEIIRMIKDVKKEETDS